MAEIVCSGKIRPTKMDKLRAGKICDAIQKYHDFFKVSEEYTEANKFSKWYEQYGEKQFESEEVDNVVICCYLQFDSSLPVPNKVKRFKDEVQFEILRYCFKWYTPPPLDQISQFYYEIEDRHEAYEFMKN